MTDAIASAGRIDVQFHFSPEFYTERVKQAGGHITTDRWSVAGALEYMARHHVVAGVMSVSTPGVNFLEKSESVAMARLLNDAAAKVARDNPGRFGNFATLPMLDVAATLAEIAYCLDELKMEGVCVMSNIGGVYPGHESFAPIFDALNRRKAIVFIHPTDPSYGKVNMAPVVEWPYDTARAAIDLMYSGTVKRCPDIKFILAHAGGALPSVSPRVRGMSIAFAAQPSANSNAETTAEIAGFYYDLAIAAYQGSIGILREISSLDHVLFACDWPFAPDMAVATNVRSFEALKITAEERYAIERGNAEKLFPALAKSELIILEAAIAAPESQLKTTNHAKEIQMSVDGNWTLTIQTPMGPQDSKLVLKSDNAELTGELETPGGPVSLNQGRQTDTLLTWESNFTVPFPMVAKFALQLEGDALAGTADFGGMFDAKISGVRA